VSCKDTRFYRNCVICGDRLVGTDDGLDVFESLREQLADPEVDEPNCTLCGEGCPVLKANDIIARGEPKLHDADPAEVNDDG
jgi:hypothetical protein